MSAPLISVLIPTYNRPDALCELLEALTRQTFRDFEAVIVNDGGASVDFVRELYPELRIRIVDAGHNGKHVAARNLGLSAAQGQLILLCDDDDLLLPGHIQRMLAALEGTDGSGPADLVYSDVEIFDFRWEGRTRIPTRRYLFAYRLDLVGMREFSTFVPSGTLYRKAVHERLGGFDPAVYHYWDWDFFLRVSEQFTVKRVPVASVLYAFSNFGQNLSNDLAAMKPYLDKLCAKHNLGELPVENFFTLLEEEGVRKRRALSEAVWDFSPVISRWAAADP